MLINSKDLIGLKIMTLKTGEFVDTVKDIIYDPKANQVLALLISEGGWFSDAKVILFDDIDSIGKDAVVVDTADVIKAADAVQSRVKDIAQSDTYLTTTKIVTEKGEELGKVTDILFDSDSGKVEEFEVSGGAFQDVKEGRKLVKIDDIITIGKDATVVRSYTVAAFEAQAQEGGLQGMVNDLKDKAQEIRNDPRTQEQLENIKQKASDIRDTASDKFQQAREQAPGKVDQLKNSVETRAGVVKGSTEEQLMDNAAGQVLTKTVYDPGTNEVIGELGEEVDYKMLNRAKQAGVLEQITGNVRKPLE